MEDVELDMLEGILSTFISDMNCFGKQCLAYATKSTCQH